jgi:hypothetical protein
VEGDSLVSVLTFGSYGFSFVWIGLAIAYSVLMASFVLRAIWLSFSIEMLAFSLPTATFIYFNFQDGYMWAAMFLLAAHLFAGISSDKFVKTSRPRG